ncbi:hypothetical protein SLH49_03095 [Cognatiyoonia sp. IB215446]|uniref:hypothetical protein n=1 Tax=Cognatiyoonia sp. IB215446 TaxID=3097355 RepID=UPI002A0E5EAD|nr:hypothetical protein [Cognatiyoonia sp. IB215446]MDX8346963.1 hypothetical protein [Cognatiyoonia sp. IB215446]
MHTTLTSHRSSVPIGQPADGLFPANGSVLDDPEAGPVIKSPKPIAGMFLRAKFANVVRHYRKIGLAILVGVLTSLLLLGTSGLSSTLTTHLQTGMPSIAMGVAILLVYIVLLAVPFVPSAEIGLAVMLALGSSVALPVYAATILGLTIAFATGRFADRARSADPASTAQTNKDALAILHQKLGRRPVLQRLMRFRGLALIFMINMPGNTVFGGGGGIAMAVGYSRTLTYPAFLTCIAIAVAPVPALFLVAGAIGLEDWIHGLLGSVH